MPPGRRRPLLPVERMQQRASSAFPLDVGGYLPGTPRLTLGSARAAATAAPNGLLLRGRRHYQAVLKAAGVAPAATYTLLHVPADQPFWPHVAASGNVQHHLDDWTIAGRTLTIEAGMDLRTDDVLWVAYDYLDAIPLTPTSEGGIVFTAGSAGVDGTTFTVPAPIAPEAGDLLVAVAVGGATGQSVPGFTQRHTNSDLSNGVVTVWTKTAAGGETGVDFSVSPAEGAFGSGAIACIRGVTYGSTSSTSSGSKPHALPTPTVAANELVVVVGIAVTAPGAPTLLEWSGGNAGSVISTSYATADSRRQQIIGGLVAPSAGALPALSFTHDTGPGQGGVGVVVRTTAT